MSHSICKFDGIHSPKIHNDSIWETQEKVTHYFPLSELSRLLRIGLKISWKDSDVSYLIMPVLKLLFSVFQGLHEQRRYGLSEPFLHKPSNTTNNAWHLTGWGNFVLQLSIWWWILVIYFNKGNAWSSSIK